MAKKSAGCVLAVDVGTTNITCHVFDNSGISKYGAIRKVCSTRDHKDILFLGSTCNSHILTFIQYLK
jgi:hypothetical protein